MSSQHAIKAEGIGKQYVIGGTGSGDLRESVNQRLRSIFASNSKERFWALKDISFTVSQGDAIGIVGRNGAGKSTLLKILSRITEPTVGKFELFGRVSSLLEVGTGFHPELTGRENVFLNGTILGMGRKEISNKFDEIIAFSGVEKFIDTPIKYYSSGMKVRLAFAVAAHLEPEILIIDEVLAVGDAEFQQKCLGKMGEVTQEGRTVIFVSHDLEAVNDLCNKGVFLENGTISFTGTAEQTVNAYMRSFHESSEVIERVFEPKQGAGHIRKARFLTHKNSPNFEFDERIAFEFDYELNEDLPDAELNIALFRGKEKIAMFFGRELTNGNKSERGSNSVKLNLPVGLLNNGNYHLNLSLHDNYRKFLDVRTEALSFNILNKHPRYADHTVKDPGILRPPSIQHGSRLMWPFKKKKDYDHADAIIIGAQRSGTTSLFEYLSQHSDILPAKRKEVHYFDNNFQHGPEWYSEFFTEPVLGKVRLEASPYYVFHPHVAKRIADTLPAAKLILILRDPIERAYSHFRLMKKLDREPLDLIGALRSERERLAKEIDKMLKDSSYRSPAHQDHSYCSRGHYDQQIEQWHQHFPPEQILILRTQELETDTNATLRKVTDHLGICPFPEQEFPVHNHIEGEPMDDAAKAFLEEEFKESRWLNRITEV